MTSTNNYNEVTATYSLEQCIALQHAYELVENDPALQHCMLDTSADGKTLLVFCSGLHDTAYVHQAMKHVWQGDVEALNAGMFANNS